MPTSGPPHAAGTRTRTALTCTHKGEGKGVSVFVGMKAVGIEWRVMIQPKTPGGTVSHHFCSLLLLKIRTRTT